jgi:Flagellar hook-length control protein FliK
MTSAAPSTGTAHIAGFNWLALLLGTAQASAAFPQFTVQLDALPEGKAKKPDADVSGQGTQRSAGSETVLSPLILPLSLPTSVPNSESEHGTSPSSGTKMPPCVDRVMVPGDFSRQAETKDSVGTEAPHELVEAAKITRSEPNLDGEGVPRETSQLPPELMFASKDVASATNPEKSSPEINDNDVDTPAVHEDVETSSTPPVAFALPAESVGGPLPQASQLLESMEKTAAQLETEPVEKAAGRSKRLPIARENAFPEEHPAAIRSDRLAGKAKREIRLRSVSSIDSSPLKNENWGRAVAAPETFDQSEIPVGDRGETATAAEKSSLTSPDDPPAKPAVAFHVLRLAERIAGPEMHFSWQSRDKGELQVSATVQEGSVQMVVNTDRPEMANAMRAELPALDSRLHEHSLQLGEVRVASQQCGLSTELSMAGQQHQNREWTRQQVPAVRSAEASEAPIELSLGNLADKERLSVLA